MLRGGMQGRERLRIVSRVMGPPTIALLKEAGIRPGMRCLEVACGSGDLAFDMARLVGPSGTVIATDIDDAKLAAARLEAETLGLSNVEFRFSDITECEFQDEFDLVHARFILSHLPDPHRAVNVMLRSLHRRGVLILEDVDFRGSLCYPESAAFCRYVELYTLTARLRGADANIGARLPDLLMKAGCSTVHVTFVQPAGVSGEVKLLPPMTMEAIADAVLTEGLASREEIDTLVDELYAFARTPGTLGCTPRIVQVWASKE